MGLGRVEPQNERRNLLHDGARFQLSRCANAVSSLHGHVSRRMWAHLWPWRVEEKSHRPHHQRRAYAELARPQMQQLYDRNFPVNWFQRMGEPEVWQGIQTSIPANCGKLTALKNLLLSFVRRRVSRQRRRRGEKDDRRSGPQHARSQHTDDRLCRRFATYKRADLILTDIERCTIGDDPERPVQFVFAGKRIRPTSPATVDQEDLEPAARPALRRARGLHRGLRYQRLPPHDSRRGRVAEQPAPSAGSVGHERPKSGAQRRLEPVGARRLVGRSLRRLERLRDRQGDEPRLGRGERPPRCGDCTACWKSR